jgi:hypothetical protein
LLHCQTTRQVKVLYCPHYSKHSGSDNDENERTLIKRAFNITFKLDENPEDDFTFLPKAKSSTNYIP